MERTNDVEMRGYCESSDQTMIPAEVLLNVELECVKRECDRLREQITHEKTRDIDTKERESDTSSLEIAQELKTTQELLKTKEKEILEFQKYKQEWFIREKNLYMILNEVDIFGMTEI